MALSRNDFQEETMKRLTVALLSSLFVASAGATHLYKGLAEGEPDLYGYGVGDQQVTGIQPGVGDTSTKIYGDFGRGNDDLFTAQERGGVSVDNPDRSLPRIYKGFAGDPDLSW
jgi:hypothetical protein